MFFVVKVFTFTKTKNDLSRQFQSDPTLNNVKTISKDFTREPFNSCLFSCCFFSDRVCRVLMSGDSAVGKSSLVLRFKVISYIPSFMPPVWLALFCHGFIISYGEFV